MNCTPSRIFLAHEDSHPDDHKISQLYSHSMALCTSLTINNMFIIPYLLYMEKESNSGKKFQTQFEFTLIPHILT